MRRSSSKRIPLAVAVSALGGLSLLNWAALKVPIDVDPITFAATSTSGAQQPPAVRSAARDIQKEDLRDMISRPLFHPDRRPAPVNTARAEAPPVEATGLELVGLMTDTAGRQRALIRAPDMQANWVGVGERVVGWTVRLISTDKVEVEAQGRRTALQLYQR